MIFGHKTVSWLDVWSLEHVVAGLTLGGLVLMLQQRKQPNVPQLYYYLTILLLAYTWETLEHYIETDAFGWPPVIAQWFQGVEFWGNRLITDPMMMLLGAYLIRQMRWLCWPARFFSIAWLYLHLFIFPHSMYLHELF